LFNSYFTALVELPGTQPPLIGMFSWDLVALSVAVAICGAWAALSCLARALSVHTESPVGSALWKLSGGIAFGGAIWGMHFVGMLAFSLPCGITYDFLQTSLSILPGILASLTAMSVVGRTEVGVYTRLAVGSVLMGIGIGAMHYAGMAAMRLPAILLYDPWIAALSVAAAVGLSFIALLVIELGQQRASSFFMWKLIAAVILGSAVATMHYVAMQAAIFYPTLGAEAAEGQLSQTVMALLVGLGTLALAGVVGTASFAARLKETARNLAEEVRYRAAAEKTARADEMRLQAIFDTAVDAIIVIDGKGLIRQWSESAERIFGYAADEVLGRNIAIIMYDIDAAEHDGFLRRYQETGEASIIGIGREVMGRCKDGSPVPIDLSVGKAVVDGEVLYTGILRDITKRKKIERELQAAIQVKIANELKSNFLAHMSHEMRTPLNAILGFSDIMRTQAFGKLLPAYRSYAEDIFSSGNNLLNQVNALLDLSKIEKNAQEIEPADVDLRAMLHDITGMLRERSEKKQLTMSVLIDNDLPQKIRSDRGKLFQVLFNIVNNAVKYTTDKGRISFRVWPGDDAVQILIEDNGTGMTEEEITHALQPFGQLKSAFTAGDAGTGLGLPVAVSFIELLGGDIRIESIKGIGTTVRIRVPSLIDEQFLADSGAGGRRGA